MLLLVLLAYVVGLRMGVTAPKEKWGEGQSNHMHKVVMRDVLIVSMPAKHEENEWMYLAANSIE